MCSLSFRHHRIAATPDTPDRPRGWRLHGQIHGLALRWSSLHAPGRSPKLPLPDRRASPAQHAVLRGAVASTDPCPKRPAVGRIARLHKLSICIYRRNRISTDSSLDMSVRFCESVMSVSLTVSKQRRPTTRTFAQRVWPSPCRRGGRHSPLPSKALQL